MAAVWEAWLPRYRCLLLRPSPPKRRHLYHPCCLVSRWRLGMMPRSRSRASAAEEAAATATAAAAAAVFHLRRQPCHRRRLRGRRQSRHRETKESLPSSPPRRASSTARCEGKAQGNVCRHSAAHPMYPPTCHPRRATTDAWRRLGSPRTTEAPTPTATAADIATRTREQRWPHRRWPTPRRCGEGRGRRRQLVEKRRRRRWRTQVQPWTPQT